MNDDQAQHQGPGEELPGCFDEVLETDADGRIGCPIGFIDAEEKACFNSVAVEWRDVDNVDATTATIHQ